MNLQFVKDFAVVPFNRIQGEEKPLANLTIRESLGNELQYFQLALAQWLAKGLASGAGDKSGLSLALPLLSFKCSQQLTYIVRHNPMSSRFGQQLSHRGTFVHKDTDEAARLCQRQRLTQQLHSLVLFAMGMESDRL